MSGNSSEELSGIESIYELRENLSQFNAAVESCEPAALEIARKAHYWVFDSESERFAPCLFVAYKKMTLDRYLRARAGSGLGGDVKFDGSIARRRVASFGNDPTSDERLTRDLRLRLTKYFGDGAADRFNWGKWQFSTLRATNYWAFACDPRKYDALSACGSLDEIVWAAGRLNPRIGDRAIIWQLKGGGTERGVVGLGEIIDGPAMLSESEKEKCFWKIERLEPELSVRIRLFESMALPLWESQHKGLLSGLAVARAYGGTIFTLQRSHWQHIWDAACTVASNHNELEGSNQGWMADTCRRDAVEQYAQMLVTKYFETEGFKVRDVSATSSFDLLCVRGDEELHVEVKGSTAGGGTVFLTRNEVVHARNNPANAVLAVVSGIRLAISGAVNASGGDVQVIHPWKLKDSDLVALQYQYRVQRS